MSFLEERNETGIFEVVFIQQHLFEGTSVVFVFCFDSKLEGPKLKLNVRNNFKMTENLIDVLYLLLLFKIE